MLSNNHQVCNMSLGYPSLSLPHFCKCCYFISELRTIKRDNCTKGMSFLVKIFLKGTNCNFQEVQSGEMLLRLHENCSS